MFIVYFPILEKKVNDALNYRKLSFEQSFFFYTRKWETNGDILDSPANWGRQSILARLVGIGGSTRRNKINTNQTSVRRCSTGSRYRRIFARTVSRMRNVNKDLPAQNWTNRIHESTFAKVSTQQSALEVPLLSFQIGAWPLINFFLSRIYISRDKI